MIFSVHLLALVISACVAGCTMAHRGEERSAMLRHSLAQLESADAWSSLWKSDLPYSGAIQDPMTWAAAQFMDRQGASVEEARLESFEIDIDHDGTRELFVTSQMLHGNAGGPYLVFQRIDSSYRYIGQVGMSRHSFRVSPLGPDNRPRIVIYRRMSGGETGSGSIVTLCNDGMRFTIVHIEDVSSRDASRRYEEVFSQSTEKGADANASAP